MLKLIPREIVSSEQKNNKNQQRFKHQLPKIAKPVLLEDRLLKNVGWNVMKYVKKAESYGIKETGELIHQLQRSVLILEKKRIQLVKKTHPPTRSAAKSVGHSAYVRSKLHPRKK